ncbi:MAG: membrane protein insertase YidC [Clostridiales bacterium]|nr:membrane protein insertase YidC [Clostridiales bacterium]
MGLINDLIGTPLGHLMHWCYIWVGSYGAAILLFTLLTKIILFPLSVIAQKNSIKMVRMAPELDDIKRYNSGNGELIAQEIGALYKREKYSTVAGVLPLLVQIPIILGLINVIYNPLQHLMRLDRGVTLELTAKAAGLLGKAGQDLGYSGQILVLEEMRRAPEAFAGLKDVTQALNDASALNMDFFGINLSATPSPGSLSFIIPVLSGASALLLCLVQNKYNVLQENAGFVSKWGMTIFLVAFSAYFAAALPGGLGLYWTAGNLISIPVLGVCNLIYNPKKYIDYEAMAERRKETPGEKKAANEQKKALAARSKQDMRRFFAEGNRRELVIYSEASGFYKYFKGYVEHILGNSDIDIHYVTSDPGDRIFGLEEPRIKPYYANEKDLVALFMKMDADVFLMTTPDLEKYQLKRSLVSKGVEYIYTDHGMTSLHLMLREGALDHYDTIFLCGPNHIDEVRQTEYVYGLPQKTLVKTGFALLDELLERVAALGEKENARKKVLIAPSWQKDNLLDYCLEELVGGLSGKGYDIVIRPHPEFVKRFPNKVEKIRELYEGRIGKDIELETDFSSSESIYTADVIVTDWSSVAQEYSYTTKKPSLFVNTPMKIVNPNYDKIKAVPLDIALRGEIGVSVDVEELGGIGEIVGSLIEGKEGWRDRITKTVEHYIYNIGDGARDGAEYIIGRIEHKRKARAS